MGRNVPLTFTASTWSQSSVLISHTGVPTGPVTPAALTRMSMRPPSVFFVRSTRRRTAASAVTSVTPTSARRPSFPIPPQGFSGRATPRAAGPAAEMADGLLAGPAFGVQPDVDDEAFGTEQLRPQHAQTVVAIAVHAELGAEAFGVERPALAERVVPAKAAKAGQAAVLALQRHLQMMAGHGLVQEQVSGDGDAAPLAQGRGIQVEHARARAVGW